MPRRSPQCRLSAVSLAVALALILAFVRAQGLSVPPDTQSAPARSRLPPIGHRGIVGSKADPTLPGTRAVRGTEAVGAAARASGQAPETGR